MARAVQAAYNVFLLDTDVLLFDDPYKYFKTPPFSAFQLLAQVRSQGRERASTQLCSQISGVKGGRQGRGEHGG